MGLVLKESGIADASAHGVGNDGFRDASCSLSVLAYFFAQLLSKCFRVVYLMHGDAAQINIYILYLHAACLGWQCFGEKTLRWGRVSSLVQDSRIESQQGDFRVIGGSVQLFLVNRFLRQKDV